MSGRVATRAAAAGRIERVHDEPAYVLHSHAWRETSLVLELFSRHHGRVALVAKGAKRPHSPLRSVLLGLQPLRVAWSGRGEVRTLTRAEWSGGVAPLAGHALLCGFYFNELLLRLLAREDAHERVLDVYHATLLQLGDGVDAIEPPLRAFELALLRELGHLPALDRESPGGAPLRADATYRVDSEQGVLRAAGEALPSGAQLLAIEAGDWDVPGAARAAKTLMREMLDYHLGDPPLRTRQLLIDLHQL